MSTHLSNGMWQKGGTSSHTGAKWTLTLEEAENECMSKTCLPKLSGWPNQNSWKYSPFKALQHGDFRFLRAARCAEENEVIMFCDHLMSTWAKHACQKLSAGHHKLDQITHLSMLYNMVARTQWGKGSVQRNHGHNILQLTHECMSTFKKQNSVQKNPNQFCFAHL